MGVHESEVRWLRDMRRACARRSDARCRFGLERVGDQLGGHLVGDREHVGPARKRHRDTVLYAGGGKVTYCGQYSCVEPIADAELYTP